MVCDVLRLGIMKHSFKKDPTSKGNLGGAGVLLLSKYKFWKKDTYYPVGCIADIDILFDDSFRIKSVSGGEI